MIEEQFVVKCGEKFVNPCPGGINGGGLWYSNAVDSRCR